MNSGLNRKITAGSLLKFALPSIIMMFILSLYTIVDGIFVARLVNSVAFSAVNIIYPLTGIILALGTMFGTGAAAIISKKFGEGKNHEAREHTTFIIIVTVVISIVITALCLIFLKPLIYFLGADETVYEYCRAYALPIICFFPTTILQLQFQNLFVVNGKPHIGLILTIIGGLLNVLLDYIFIAVCHMGIQGAAIATGIGGSITAVFGVFYFLFHRKGNIFFVKPVTAWKVLGHAALNGSSEMVSALSASITTIMFNLIMMHFIGNQGVAAISVLLYLDFVLVAISLGYSIGVAPIISFNYGNQNTDKLKKIFRLSMFFCLITGALITVLAAVLSPYLAMIFVSKNSEVYKLASMGLRIYAFGYLFKGFNIFSSALFTAFSNGKISALISFMRTLVLLTSVLAILTAIFGVNGVWYASPVAESLSFILSVFCVIRYGGKYGYLNPKRLMQQPDKIE